MSRRLPRTSRLAPLLLIGLGTHAAGCKSTMSGPSSAPLSCGSSETRFFPVELKTKDGVPPVALVIREGDPQPAVALVVAAKGGSFASAGLSAVVEGRMRAQGWGTIQAHADGQGFRVVVALDDESRAAAFVSAARTALATPVTTKSPELAAAVARVAVLQKNLLASSSLAAVTACTGEIGVAAAEGTAAQPEAMGAEQLESWREATFELGRVAFGAAGPASVGKVLASAVASEPWPSRSRSADPWPTSDSWGSYTLSGGPPGTARVDVALWVDLADRAVGAATRLARTDSALIARLAALPVPFRVVEVAGVARSRGGCLAATLETVRPVAAAHESAAALAAAITRQEFDREQARFQQEHPSDESDPSQLDGQAARAARSTSDPRQAAARAAWWSLSDRTGTGGPSKLALALGVATPPETRDGKASEPVRAEATVAQRLWSAFQAAETSLQTPVLDHRERVEVGQGELWVLLATPCGTGGESMYDAGQTALALLTRIAEHERDDPSVTIEPWITPDGIGLLAHAPRLGDETSATHAIRVAEQAGRAFVSTALRPDTITDARARLLDRIAVGPTPDGRVLATAAGMLAPLHPSWLSPLGTWEGVLRTGPDAISARWQALLEGPMRVSVLANESHEQAEAAIATVDRWIVRSSSASQDRVCPVVEPTVPTRPGTLLVDWPSPKHEAQAILAAAAPAEGQPNRIWFELTAAALNGPTGLLRRTLAPLSATAEAKLVGGARTSALIIDVRAAEGALDGAVGQVRDLLRRLRQGGVSSQDLDRAVAALRSDEIEAAFDPRRRLADLWAGRASKKLSDKPSLEAWQGWVASGLAEDRLVVVMGKPKH